ncbi:MAG: hypothetical protein PHX47_02570 [Candidatus ainarchaeum sp.]|nr:hypothetical protein [Candidatus ainarchaeum sp.]
MKTQTKEDQTNKESYGFKMVYKKEINKENELNEILKELNIEVLK